MNKPEYFKLASMFIFIYKIENQIAYLYNPINRSFEKIFHYEYPFELIRSFEKLNEIDLILEGIEDITNP